MKKLSIIITISCLSAQMPFDCLFNKTSSLNRSKLQSNAIIDIRYGLDNELYIGTGDSLGYADITDPLSPIFSIVRDTLLPEGGIPALKTYKLNDDDIMIVLSGAVTTYKEEEEECFPSGTGIAWSIDSGTTWNHMSQFIESPDSPLYSKMTWGGQQLKYLTITTTIQNISYDLDVQGNYIYSTSWAGGLRRFNYKVDTPEWEVIPLPMDDQDSLYCKNIDFRSYSLNPVEIDNQKAFSIYAESDTILWVGSAGGINKGVVQGDGCINWKNYNKDDGLEFWIIGIIPQHFDSFTRLWLISWDSAPPSGHKLTYTDDGGKTWDVVTQFENLDIVVYNLSFSSKNIIATTDHGLYKSAFDDGKFWIPLPVTEDINGERILTNNYYTAISISEGEIDTFLVGTEDGLSIISTAGEILDNIREWESPTSFSAYPNPFFINEYNQVDNNKYVRLIYSNPNQFSGEIDIFDFAMDHVIYLNNFKPITIDENEIVWNGRNKSGDKVANGAYFCRLSLNGKYNWTKLAVIN